MDGDREYAVVVGAGDDEKTYRSGLSHPAAMILAEELQGEGKVARVMHVLGSARCEVDRYPPR